MFIFHMYTVNADLFIINSRFNVGATKIIIWMDACKPVHMNLLIKQISMLLFAFKYKCCYLAIS